MSNYRDDREALHARVAQLEEALEDAKRDGAKKDVQLDELRQAAKSPGALPPGVSRAQLKWIVIGSFAALGVVIGALMLARTDSTANYVPPPIPAPPTAVAPTPQPVERVAPIPLEKIPTPPAPQRSTTARWTAKVTRAEGVAVAPGSTCTIDATIFAKNTNSGVSELVVQCGTQMLYRSTDKFSGTSQSHNDAREQLGPADDKSTFTIAYGDIGSRTGERAQIDLDTTKRQGSVFRDTIPRFRVDFAVPPSSAVAPAMAGPEQRLRRTGKVTHVTGTSPVKEGASCTLRAMPIGKQADCVAEVTCGTTIAWPTTANVKCTYDDSRPTTVAAAEEPTGLVLEGSKLEVKSKAYGLEIALDD